uniref:uncharacterized protein LOC105352276 n=1 Tax=Fragaria vesca subsp. vesca TaxID=101020 RepID=UPI0005CA8C20|nr:PREDICTED: uncharacterized protein LOC105352276 [Fragaria vesca subsp. vesca]
MDITFSHCHNPTMEQRISSLASKMYNEDRQMTLKEMVHNQPFDKNRLIASLITSVYVLVLSTCSVILGFIWSAASYYFVFRYLLHDVLLSLWCLVACLALLTIYLAWNAIWNMIILISILEGLHGTKAFGLAIYVSFGNEWAGFLLMLIFFASEVSLRLPCLYFGCKERWNPIYVAEISLLCFGNVLKWVVFNIYLHDCKNWIVEKRLLIKAKNSAGEQSCV